MADLNGFDASKVEPGKSRAVLPIANYPMVIVKSEWKGTKSGRGKFLAFTFQVIEGQHKDRQLIARLNLKNANPTAVQIAEEELSSICHAVGVLKPNDSEDLHDIPLMVSVTQKEREDNGKPANEIDGYSKMTRTAAPPQQTDPHQTAPYGQSEQAAPATNSGRRSW